MLNFKPITKDSINEINEFLQFKQFRTCDYTVGALFMWREYYKSQYAICNDTVFFKVDLNENDWYFTLPISKEPIEKSLALVEKYAKDNNMPIKFCTIPESQVMIIEDYFDGNVVSTGDRDVSDYIYVSTDLSELKGRRYSGQRNHINKFHKLYDNFSFSPITPENKNKVMEFYDEFFKNMTKTAPTAIEEGKRTKEILEHLEELPLFGGFIEVENNIIAMSIGEIINDTLYVHIEKALKEVPGSYQMIVNQFAKAYVTEDVKYINREDDAGDLGLRSSKLSYHPCELLNKYTIIVQ